METNLIILPGRDIPALKILPVENGLVSVVYVSTPSIIRYQKFKI